MFVQQLICVAALVTVVAARASASPPPAPAPPPSIATTSATTPDPSSAPLPQGVYCGIHCIYGAINFEGAQVKLSDLLDRKYVGCSAGSTFQELQRAAVDHGLHARPALRLSASALRALDCPAVLFVRSEPAAPEPNHYVLLLPATSDSAEPAVIDPARPQAAATLPDVLPLWSGDALLVSRQPINLLPLAAADLSSVLVYALAASCVLLAVGRMERRHGVTVGGGRSLARSARQAAAMACVALAVGFAYHRVCDDGIYGSRRLAAQVDAAFAPVRVRFVTVSEFAAAVETGGSLIIDARPPATYHKQPIKGSLNMPADSDRAARDRAMSRVNPGKPIIVFCQNAACAMSDGLARKLMTDGYRDVGIFRGGWDAWAASASASASAAPAAAAAAAPPAQSRTFR
jgi:rhodanese-related sulfurtransferase